MNQLKAHNLIIRIRIRNLQVPITTMKIRKETNMKHMKRLKYTTFLENFFLRAMRLELRKKYKSKLKTN